MTHFYSFYNNTASKLVKKLLHSLASQYFQPYQDQPLITFSNAHNPKTSLLKTFPYLPDLAVSTYLQPHSSPVPPASRLPLSIHSCPADFLAYHRCHNVCLTPPSFTRPYSYLQVQSLAFYDLLHCVFLSVFNVPCRVVDLGCGHLGG